jgi:hypothetical protein
MSLAASRSAVDRTDAQSLEYEGTGCRAPGGVRLPCHSSSHMEGECDATRGGALCPGRSGSLRGSPQALRGGCLPLKLKGRADVNLANTGVWALRPAPSCGPQIPVISCNPFEVSERSIQITASYVPPLTERLGAAGPSGGLLAPGPRPTEGWVRWSGNMPAECTVLFCWMDCLAPTNTVLIEGRSIAQIPVDDSRSLLRG